MDKKIRKILLVGDLRTAGNYGAVATTESLLDLIRGAAPDAELRLIDSRSFSGNTPIGGWPVIPYETYLHNGGNRRRRISRVGNRFAFYRFLREVYHTLGAKKIDAVPARLNNYKVFGQKVKNGTAWRYEKDCIEWADIVLINSEGNIVHGTDAQGLYRQGGRYVLFFAYLAQLVFGKPCYIINHTVDPQNRDIKKIISYLYPKMDGIYVREKMSMKLLQDMGIYSATYVPDALWSHDFTRDGKVKAPQCMKGFDFSKPYICIGDSSGIRNGYSRVKWDVVETYSRLITKLKDVSPQIVFVDGYDGMNEEIYRVIKKNRLPSVSLHTCNWHELYYVLSHADIFISGRWHASILALLGETPILLWGSDSHKTEALYGEIDYPYEFFDVDALPLNIDRVVNEAKKIILQDHRTTWERVRELRKGSFHNVDMLDSCK